MAGPGRCGVPLHGRAGRPGSAAAARAVAGRAPGWPLVIAPRSGSPRRRCAAASRSAASPGRGWRSARPTPRWPSSPRSAARRGHLRGALTGAARLLAGLGCWPCGRTGAGRRASPAWPRSPSWSLVRCPAASPRCSADPDRRAAGAGRGASRGTCPGPGWSSTPQRRAVLRQPRRRHPGRWPRGRGRHRRRDPTSWSGRRTPPTSTRSQRRRGRRDQRRRHATSACRSWSARVLDGPAPSTIRNVGLLYRDPVPGRAPSATSSSTRCRSREYIPFRSFVRQAQRQVDLVRARLGRRATAGRLLQVRARATVGRRHLLRGRLRRAGARHRAGRRAASLRGADQQRHLRLHRRVRAAAGHVAGCAPSSTAGRSCTPRPAASARSSPPTAPAPAHRVVHSGRARRRPCRCGRPHGGRPRRRAAASGACVAVALLAWALACCGAGGGRGAATVEHGGSDDTDAACRPGPSGAVAWSCSSRPTTSARTCRRSSPGCGPPCPTRRAGRSTTTARTAPASSPTSWPPTTTTCTCCTARARRASAPPTSPGSAGRWTDGLRRRWSRWTPTARTSPSSCPRLLDGARRAPTWCSAPAGCPAARWSTGRCHREFLSRGGNIYTRVLLGMPVRDATGGYRAFRRETPGGLDLDEVASQGYCFQVDLAWRAVRAGLPRRRGADHLRRARGAATRKMSRDIVARRWAGSPGGAWRTAPGRPASLLHREPRWHRALGPGRPAAPGPRPHGLRRDPLAPAAPAVQARLLIVGLLLVPLVELGLLIAVGQLIGGWPTLVLVVVEALLGAYVVKREGRRAWVALQTSLNTGQMPGSELTDAVLVLVGGVLLLLPGFLTDVVGLLFLLPVARPLTRRWLAGRWSRRPGRRAAATGVIRGEVHREGSPAQPRSCHGEVIRRTADRRTRRPRAREGVPARGLRAGWTGVRRCACGAASRHGRRAGAPGAPPAAPRARGWSGARAACPSGCGRP